MPHRDDHRKCRFFKQDNDHLTVSIDDHQTSSNASHKYIYPAQRACPLRALGLLLAVGAPTVHNVHFVKYDVTVSFYDTVSDTIRRRGGDRGIFTEEGVDTVAYFRGNHGFRV